MLVVEVRKKKNEEIIPCKICACGICERPLTENTLGTPSVRPSLHRSVSLTLRQICMRKDGLSIQHNRPA